MTRFEDRLARAVLGLGLLASCTGGGGGTTTTTVDLQGLCDGDPPPEDWSVSAGFVLVEPDAPCPDAADAELEVLGCDFREWQGLTCAFTSVAEDQVLVDDGYGGYWAAESTAPPDTGAPRDVVDVCWYDGVFYLPPDHPTCGRPLLRDGEPVLAEVRGGPSAWADGPAPVVVGLAAADREALGGYWLASALMEHASVASFARFALDLMRLGAPPELLAAAHRAALDEVEHAKLCFALAGAYLGRPVGPGELAAELSLVDVAEALVREGCVGETLAAIDAAARLAVARDGAVRQVLATIHRDESAHAALAWRTLAWMLGRDPDLRRHLDGVFAEERARLAALSDDGVVSAGARAHGLLSARERKRALERAWDDVIGPSWAELSQRASS